MAEAGRESLDHLQYELAVLARRTERVRTAALDDARSPLDRSGYLLLTLLDEEGDQTMSALAAAFDLDASTVTRQVAPLERRGYVRRERSSTDRRATIVQITVAGRDERTIVREARTTHMGHRLSDWEGSDVDALAVLVGRLNQTLAETAGPGGDGGG